MRDRLENLLNRSIEELFTKDFVLLKNDVSERAITHKLAIYLQDRFPELNVDCEYNRNVERGIGHPKSINVIKRRSITEIKKKYNFSEEKLVAEEEDLAEVTSYPDIIVHRREINERNLLVVEVKKSNNKVDAEFDFIKLKAFTSKEQGYHFKFGVFLKFNMENPKEFPLLKWFSEGTEL